MLITDSFVMLNFPKTGSSFARKVIKDLYAREPRRWFGGRWCQELILPNIRTRGVPDQHGTYSQLPRRYRGREIVTICRNPYDRFLSVFEFRYWINVPLVPWEIVYGRLPAFPNITFDEFVDLNELVAKEFYRVPVGTQTAQFMQIFGRRFPPRPTDPWDLQSVLRRVAPATFLRQEHLRQDLRAFLHRHGFSPEKTAFIESHERVNATDQKRLDRNSLWTPKALNYVSNADALLLQIFAERGIQYEPPRALAA